MTQTYNAAIVQVGGKDMDDEGVAKSAATILLLRQTIPDAAVTLWVSGYDEDERELWDIPEVCEQVKQVVGRILRAKPDWGLDDLRLDQHSLCLVGMCYGILHITGRNPENGNYIMEMRPNLKAAQQPD